MWLAPAYEPLDITPPNSSYGQAHAINDRREVVGLIGESNREWAFRWDPRSRRVVDLGSLGGASSRALAVNEWGVAAGFAQTGEVSQVGVPIHHAAVFLARPGHR